MQGRISSGGNVAKCAPAEIGGSDRPYGTLIGAKKGLFCRGERIPFVIESSVSSAMTALLVDPLAGVVYDSGLGGAGVLGPKPPNIPSRHGHCSHPPPV